MSLYETTQVCNPAGTKVDTSMVVRMPRTLAEAVARAAKAELISRAALVRRAVAQTLENGGYLPESKEWTADREFAVD